MRVENEIWMYFIGWTVRADVPYHNAIGLAVSCDGGDTFERRFAGPVVGSTATEPLFCSTADVIRTSDELKNVVRQHDRMEGREWQAGAALPSEIRRDPPMGWRGLQLKPRGYRLPR